MTRAEIAEKLRGEDLDEWVELWRVEQGPAKPASLELMAAAIPLPGGENLRVLDLCCGPGDAGRAIASRYPNASVDFVDRDVFFVSLCAAVNQRAGIHGQTVARTVLDPDWRRDLGNDYDVIVAANCLHWFTIEQAPRLFREIFEMVRSGGSFLFMEPVSAEAPFASGFAEWRSRQPSQHSHENWIRFWSRVNALLGYDYMDLQGRPPEHVIGDRLNVLGWIGLLKDAGFQSIDVLLRDPEKVVVAAVKQ